MYLGPTKKACEISDESLLKCMKDYLEYPAKYHPEYLQILLKDYERRVNMKLTDESPVPSRPFCANIMGINTTGQ